MMESNKQTLPSSYSPVGASIPVCPDVNMEAVFTSIGASLRARVSRYPVACKTKTNQRERGFSIVELLIVVVVALILSAIAIPSVVSITRSARNNADARGISAALNLARMRAAADFTHTRIYMNLTGNTYHLELWNKASACWQTDGDTNACTQSTSPVTALASGDTFGFGSISAGPTAATSSIAQAPLCTAGVAGASPGATTANTACIEFNSRCFPVDKTNTIVASDAAYITDNLKFYSAIAVPISGQPASYRYNGSSWAQF
jgi:prepilin-type N-terminal cleavage/methylation domain-containing protein